MKNCLFLLSFIFPVILHGQTDTLYVYGPGGPYGPINESAGYFSKMNNIPVKVVAGPEIKWIKDAKKNADVIFGGAWISYASWHERLKNETMLVKIRKKETVYRGTPIAITAITNQKALATAFIAFMKSPDGHAIFKKWGWE